MRASHLFILGSAAALVSACSSSGSNDVAAPDGSSDSTAVSVPDGAPGAEASSSLTPDASTGTDSTIPLPPGPDAGEDGPAADVGQPVGTKEAGTGSATDIQVSPSVVHQTMDGFGAADTWAGPLTAAQNTLFWDPTNGIGLSILRIGIDVNGTPLGSGAYPDAKAASAFGVKVWGAPWSPPAADKSNDSEDNGGTLNTSAYASWAAILAGFPATFKTNTGVDLYGISAQNEPDFTATYASCLYSSAQMVAFANVLGPLLAKLTPPVNLIAAEPDSWSNLWGGDGYGPAIVANTQTPNPVNIIATHDYGHKSDSVTTRPAPPAGVTQHIWETEMSDETAADVDIGHGIQVATWVYAAVTTGGANAWHYWWLINANTDGEGLLQMGGDTTNPPKRLYTLGNFSKFVRPGYVRVDVSGPVPAGVLVVAFQNPTDSTVAIVAINSNTTDTAAPFFVSGTAWPAQVTPYVTSATDNLAAQTAIPLSGGSFMATLAAQTVTTFVGKP